MKKRKDTNEFIFAKLFSIGEQYQVLVTLDYEPDTEESSVVVRTDVGIGVSMNLSMKTQDAAQQLFESYDQEAAEKHFQFVLEQDVVKAVIN